MFNFFLALFFVFPVISISNAKKTIEPNDIAINKVDDDSESKHVKNVIITNRGIDTFNSCFTWSQYDFKGTIVNNRALTFDPQALHSISGKWYFDANTKEIVAFINSTHNSLPVTLFLASFSYYFTGIGNYWKIFFDERPIVLPSVFYRKNSTFKITNFINNGNSKNSTFMWNGWVFYFDKELEKFNSRFFSLLALGYTVFNFSSSYYFGNYWGDNKGGEKNYFAVTSLPYILSNPDDKPTPPPNSHQFTYQGRILYYKLEDKNFIQFLNLTNLPELKEIYVEIIADNSHYLEKFLNLMVEGQRSISFFGVWWKDFTNYQLQFTSFPQTYNIRQFAYADKVKNSNITNQTVKLTFTADDINKELINKNIKLKPDTNEFAREMWHLLTTTPDKKLYFTAKWWKNNANDYFMQLLSKPTINKPQPPIYNPPKTPFLDYVVNKYTLFSVSMLIVFGYVFFSLIKRKKISY